MPLTTEQETELLKSNAEMKATLSALAPSVEALKTQLSEKEAAIKVLQTHQLTSSQDAALVALKAKYPDVPEGTLKALPESLREEQGKILQESFGKLKSASVLKTGPSAWSDVGGIGPSVEAEDAAQLALRETARAKAVSSGNFMDVLRIKSRDTVDFIQKNFATR
jgi:hypothetical protein